MLNAHNNNNVEFISKLSGSIIKDEREAMEETGKSEIVPEENKGLVEQRLPLLSCTITNYLIYLLYLHKLPLWFHFRAQSLSPS